MTTPSNLPPHDAAPANLLQVQPGREQDEVFEDLLRRPGLRIERIVSHGHSTPPEQPYEQDWDEWVLLLSGSAELELEGSGLHRLDTGEYLMIPAGVRHRVTFTASPTIWLAIHIDEPAPPIPQSM